MAKKDKKEKNNEIKTLNVFILIITILFGLVLCLISLQFDESVNPIFTTGFLAVGTAFISAGIISFLEKIANIGYITEIKEELKFTTDIVDRKLNIATEEIHQSLDKYRKMKEIGVEDIGNLNNNEIIKEIEKLEKGNEIKVMLHTGEAFIYKFKETIIAAIERGCIVKILIAHPDVSSDSNTLCQNPNILRNLCGGSHKAVIENFKIKVANDIISIIKDKDNVLGTITVKEYKFAPTGNLFIVGDYVRFIPYLSNRNSSTSIPIIGRANNDESNKFRIFIKIFDEIFDNKPPDRYEGAIKIPEASWPPTPTNPEQSNYQIK